VWFFNTIVTFCNFDEYQWDMFAKNIIFLLWIFSLMCHSENTGHKTLESDIGNLKIPYCLDTACPCFSGCMIYNVSV